MTDAEQQAARSAATRLDAAIRRWGGPRAVAAFSRVMEDRGVRGATRTTLHQLLAGERLPSLYFVSEAADVLGVRAAWLAWGEEPATPDEARLAAEIVRHVSAWGEAVEALARVRAETEDELILDDGGDDAEA